MEHCVARNEKRWCPGATGEHFLRWGWPGAHHPGITPGSSKTNPFWAEHKSGIPSSLLATPNGQNSGSEVVNVLLAHKAISEAQGSAVSVWS